MYAKGKLIAAVVAVAAAAAGLVIASGSPARAESPTPPGDMKPFTQQLPESDVKFDMLPIPGGKVQLGSPDAEADRQDDEGPQVEVELEPFYIGKFEVTQDEYDVFRNRYDAVGKKGLVPIPADKLADAVTYPTPMYELEAGPVFQRMGRGGQFPAVIMSQYAAKEYTKWLSKTTGRFYRLPTEAEWEHAARAGTKTAYYFGDDPKGLDEHAWYFDNSELKDGDPAYHEVGKKKPNPWGLYDVHGNVAELVVDQYADDWYEQLKGKGGTVKWTDAINWPTKQYPRLARGGGYESDAEDLRSARRHELKPGINQKDPQLPRSPHWYSDGFWVGMRLVSPVKQPSEAEQRKYWEADPQTAKTLDQKSDRQVRELITPPDKAAGAGGSGGANK